MKITQGFLTTAITLVFLVFGLSKGKAQTSDSISQEPKWALQLGVQHQDLTLRIPYGQLGTIHQVGIRPYYSLGAQRSFGYRKKSHRFFSGQIGFYNNTYHENWLCAKLGYGREFQFLKKGFVSLRLETGLIRAKNSDVQYIYESGEWVKAKNYAQASMDITLAPRLDFGYRILEGNLPIDLLVSSQLMIHYDSSIGSGLPTYGAGLGLRFHL